MSLTHPQKGAFQLFQQRKYAVTVLPGGVPDCIALQGGDLSDALHCDSRPRLEWAHGGKELALQIALGVSQLHERQVIFADPDPLSAQSCPQKDAS